MKIYTKEWLIDQLQEIKSRGWIPNNRRGNDGAVGNVLEDLLGISENNLPIANASEWELKAQRKVTTSMTTLFHMEPSPRQARLVPKVILPIYGWPHDEAGGKYSIEEMSFRQTINAVNLTDRGFRVIVDRHEEKILVSFDSSSVAEHHSEWINRVAKLVGLGELNPQPYWGFDDLYHKAATKLLNMFYVVADTKTEDGTEYFRYDKIMKLQECDRDKLITAIEKGDMLVDFDARSGHNHGTKFRLRQNKLPDLYGQVEVL